jgi:hypothetical protein
VALLWAKVAAISPAADEIHPEVEDRRSGGIGHLEGDESRSIVGMVPTHKLLPYREHDGRQNPHMPERDREIIDGIRADIRSGKGIHTPLMMEHDPDQHWGSLGEGNHRLAAAVEEGVPHVPVRVVSRARDLSERAQRRARQSIGGTGGAPLHMTTNFSEDEEYPYVPPEVHPYHFRELRP